MSSISSSAGISDLMKLLSDSASPALSSFLSSTQMQANLSKAPASDVVQLSRQAMQLQEVDGLFDGTASTSTAVSDSPAMQMQNALTSLYTGSTTSASAATALADSPAMQMQDALTSLYTGSKVNLLG